jgi:hypothetical protein
MLISELLLENELPKHPHNKPTSALPTAASLNDEPEELDLDDEVDSDDELEDENVNSEHDFKSNAVALGGGLYALSAWSYPDAWLGGGYSDMNMHRITSLADETDSDLGDYEHITDQDMADGRRLEVAIYNQQTQVVFRLSASAANEAVDFMPDLGSLQQTGSVTNAQMSKLKNLETIVQTWCKSVPEEFEGRPTERRWATAEKKITSLFDFGGGSFSGDDDHPERNDPNHPEFGANSDVYNKGDEEAGAAAMAKIIARRKAEKLANSSGGAGRGKR